MSIISYIKSHILTHRHTKHTVYSFGINYGWIRYVQAIYSDNC